MAKREEMILEVAHLIWKSEMTISEFYSILGVDLNDVSHSDPGDVVTELSGIFTGWKNPPTKD